MKRAQLEELVPAAKSSPARGFALAARRLAGASPYPALAVLTVFLLFWHARVTGTLSGAACLVILALAGLWFAIGRLFLLALGKALGQGQNAGLQFLGGFFIANTILFLMVISLPWGMAANVAILAVLAAAGTAWTWRRGAALQGGADGNALPCLLAFLVSGIGATIWCGDTQTPYVLLDGKYTFQTWRDVFIHVSQIKVFAQAHGPGTIQDIKLAGALAPVYHFASYMPPAAMTALAGVPAIETYSSVQLPLGIFLTGVAAFVLIASLFGGWAGLAATIALLLLPDAYQQGTGMRYLSYHYLAQVNLGSLYGIACVALGWRFLIDACRRGKLSLVLLAYGFLSACLFYKAHLFVANAFLMMIYPCLFFDKLAARWRLLIAAVAVPVFCGVVMLSQQFPRVPVLRLDGSGLLPYRKILLGIYEKGFLKDNVFYNAFYLVGFPEAIQAAYFAGMVALCSFGVWMLAGVAALYAGRSHISKDALLLPVLVVVNYLVMALGLAMDTRLIGTADELLNRPMVWAYFILVAWSAGALYHVAIATRPQWGRAGPRALGLLTAAGILITLAGAKNAQTMPIRPTEASYALMNSVPACLVESAWYLRAHGSPGDIYVDTRNDRNLVITALSERQVFVGATTFGGVSTVQKGRQMEVAHMAELESEREMRAYATARGIGWYIQHPGHAPAWSADAAAKPAFECGGYRVYRFAA